MTLYEKYTADCKRLGFKPTMSPKDLDIAFGVNVEEKYKPMIAKSSRRRDTRPTEPSLHNHTLTRNLTKPPPKINLLDVPKIKKEPYRPQAKYTPEEATLRSRERCKAKRLAFTEAGLTVRGEPFKEKVVLSADEVKKKNSEAVKAYRAKKKEANK